MYISPYKEPQSRYHEFLRTLPQEQLADALFEQTIHRRPGILASGKQFEDWLIADNMLKLSSQEIPLPTPIPASVDDLQETLATLDYLKVLSEGLFYIMTEGDFEGMTVLDPPTDIKEFLEENFDPGYMSLEDATNAESSCMLVDDSDTVYESFIVNDAGKLFIRMWMSKGQIWIQEEDSPTVLKGMNWADTL